MPRSSEIFCQASAFCSDPWNLPKNYLTNFLPIQPRHSDFQSTCHSNPQICREVVQHLRWMLLRGHCAKSRNLREDENENERCWGTKTQYVLATDVFVVDFSLHFDLSTPCNYFISHGRLQVCERSHFSRTRQLSRKIAHFLVQYFLCEKLWPRLKSARIKKFFLAESCERSRIAL